MLQRRSLSEVDCSKYEQQRHWKHSRWQWKVWSLARSAADWTTSGDAVWSLCPRPTEGLLPNSLEPCRTDNETPVQPTSIWCVQEQKANAVPEAMETCGRTCGLGKWDVLLHWGSTADGPAGTWECLQESHFYNPSATAVWYGWNASSATPRFLIGWASSSRRIKQHCWIKYVWCKISK